MLPSSALVPAASEHRPSQSAHIVGPWARNASRSWWMSAVLSGSIPLRGVGILANLVGVLHRDARRTDPLVGPDRVQEPLKRRSASLSASVGTRCDDVLQNVPLGRVAEAWPAICFIVDQADALLVGGVERLVQRRILVEPGAYWSMIASTMPASAAAWMIWARFLWCDREADELRLARLADRVGGLLEFLALDQVDGVIELSGRRRARG